MHIAGMRLRVTFQRNTAQTDNIGNHWNEWEDYLMCWATVSAAPTGTESQGATVNPEESLDFTCRWCKQLAEVVSTRYRILAGDKVYNITYVNPMGHKHNTIKFNCRLVRGEE